MAVLGSPLHSFRGLLCKLPLCARQPYYQEMKAYQNLKKDFHVHQVTSEKMSGAQHDLHFQAATYLCLLCSVQEHLALHKEYHGKGERLAAEAVGVVGLKLPQQPRGKGWES
ncbi:LOW QUALITY PROTEIN: protein FMC1 homolog [Lacerta agilis]|uniref:LOW QUALITY PROTEIN: protein FMC1 homolog n=1 Tax=Lacerta agilis TaxID=80427 RepID=UPI001419A995|nr:LOW QUALITY PROTEIN: protein FMC1 homolog [Lacerta agilis]